MKFRNDLFSSVRQGLLNSLHSLDYALLLPLMANLPLPLAYGLSRLRGSVNGNIGRDWRSMMSGTRHIARQTADSYRTLLPQASEQKIQTLVRQRFASESREEFEGRLIIADRVRHLHCDFDSADFLAACRQRERGLVLLTPHFDSFILGVIFLGRAGVKINLMSSLGDDKSRFNPAVYRHFETKYKSMERYLNGGRVIPMEVGPRPFYQMLERNECLVILGDVPLAAGNTTVASPLFLGARRQLSGGPLRMARKTGSDLSAFVCRFDGHRHYHVTSGPIVNAARTDALDNVYGFLSQEIMASPGRWWGADLLTAMPVGLPGDSG